MKRLQNGEAIREFYSSLDTIEEYYTKKGYRKMSYLYRTLQEKLKWKMSYEAFKYHFRKEFGSAEKAISTPVKNEVKTAAKITPITETIINTNATPIVKTINKEIREIDKNDPYLGMGKELYEKKLTEVKEMGKLYDNKEEAAKIYEAHLQKEN